MKLNNSTMEDVARAAGVAPATVSRYLNNPDIVSAPTKEKITEAINRLNYVPHAAARTLASKRSRMIGAIVPSLDSSLFGRALETFQNDISNAGYTLVVASNNYDADTEIKHIKQMLSHGVDALLLIGSSRDESIYRLLRAKNIPYLLIWTTALKDKHPCIGFDNFAAAAGITDYLLDLGHKKFAMISGFVENNDRAYSRLEGVRDALSRRGLKMADENVIQTSFGVDQGREAFKRFMSRSDKPTAIICGSDPFAYGAIFESQSMGIDIPGQVSVTGFDDMWLAASLKPRLTSVKTPQQQIGALSAKYIISKLNEEDVVIPAPLDVEIIIRDSCSPAA